MLKAILANGGVYVKLGQHMSSMYLLPCMYSRLYDAWLLTSRSRVDASDACLAGQGVCCSRAPIPQNS